MSSTISSSNYYSVSASSTNGIAGLVSGMDTDSMVKEMLSGTQSKIDAQKQLKQQIEWKQEMYREVISSINTFRDKYFDTSYGSSLQTNLASASFFNSMVSSITSGSSVKIVSTGTTAQSGETSVVVSQLASKAKLQSARKMSGDQTINGSGIDVDTIKSRMESGGELSFDLTLDGVKKTINLTADDFSGGEINADTIAKAITEKTNRAFGDYVKVSDTGGKLKFSINIQGTDGNVEQGHELNITGADANYIGVTPGTSTLVSGQTKLGELGGVQGQSYEFSINGEKFSFTADTTVSAMMNKINSSSAGVKISYSSMTDSFSIEAKSTGKGYGIDIAQESGNLMSLMFGSDIVAEGRSVTGKSLNTAAVSGTALSDDYSVSSASMKMTVNGESYTFSLEENGNTPYDKATISSKLNDWLKETFGETSGEANISYDAETGKLITKQGFAVSFAAASKGDSGLAVDMGFSTASGGAGNAVTGDTEISALAGMENVSFLKADGTAATKLSEVTAIEYLDSNDSGTKQLNASFADGKLELKPDAAGTYDFSGNDAMTRLFGSSVTLGDGAMAEGAVTEGKDLLVKINGVETSRSSNTFTVDGLTLTATKADNEETIIGSTRDTDKIVDAIKAFVNDYNALVEDLYGRVTEDADYRDYKPLTSAQEDEMTEKQIELWEKKAKTGLLRSDTNINSFLNSLRSVAYTTVKGAGISLYSIGIETSSNWKDGGKLMIDEDMLRSAVESNPEAVSALFTDTTNGVSKVIADACDKTAKISSANPGSLVTLAGAKDFTAGDSNNDLYFELRRINDRLEYLQDKYDSEKTRYWKQFSNMETILSNYSAQSNMILQQFSS